MYTKIIFFSFSPHNKILLDVVVASLLSYAENAEEKNLFFSFKFHFRCSDFFFLFFSLLNLSFIFFYLFFCYLCVENWSKKFIFEMKKFADRNNYFLLLLFAQISYFFQNCNALDFIYFEENLIPWIYFALSAPRFVFFFVAIFYTFFCMIQWKIKIKNF